MTEAEADAWLDAADWDALENAACNGNCAITTVMRPHSALWSFFGRYLNSVGEQTEQTHESEELLTDSSNSSAVSLELYP